MAGKDTRVVCLGDPVTDILAHISHAYLRTITNEPGGCIPVPAHEMEELVSSSGLECQHIRLPGGSAANVCKGLAGMAQHMRCSFIGMVGCDSTGAEYGEALLLQGVEPALLTSLSGSPSATSLCLVTPDGQRTMRTCLGASLELRSASQVASGWISPGLRLLHCEGYNLYRPQLALAMAASAKAVGASVSMDLASFELVRNCLPALLELLTSGSLDVIFANEEEAMMLASELGLVEPGASAEAQVAAAQTFLLQHCQVAVTSLGPRGCCAQGRDGEVGLSAACRVSVVDTIGAGDYFTAGFLSAWLQGASLQQCSAAGCAAGSEAVQSVGAQLDPAAILRLQVSLAAIIGSTTLKAAFSRVSLTAEGVESVKEKDQSVLQSSAATVEAVMVA
ncbi:MAG: hypothetical protein WDW36_003990 [Sanguina aurantia]